MLIEALRRSVADTVGFLRTGRLPAARMRAASAIGFAIEAYDLAGLTAAQLGWVAARFPELEPGPLGGIGGGTVA